MNADLLFCALVPKASILLGLCPGVLVFFFGSRSCGLGLVVLVLFVLQQEAWTRLLQPYSRPMMTHYVIVESVRRNSIVVNSMTKLASSHLLSQIILKTFLMLDRGF